MRLDLDERYRWVRSTLERLAAIGSLHDAELSRFVFKMRDLDVRVGFHNVNLKDLVTSGRISSLIQRQLLEIHAELMPLWTQVSAPSLSSESVWRDPRWAKVSNRCSRLLLSFPEA